MTIPAEEIRLSERAESALSVLERSTTGESQAIAKRVRGLKPILLADCLHGEVVRKSAIPARLLERYEVENLYVEDLPAFWRLLYSVVKLENRRVIVVLEIVDHRLYSRWFPGGKR